MGSLLLGLELFGLLHQGVPLLLWAGGTADLDQGVLQNLSTWGAALICFGYRVKLKGKSMRKNLAEELGLMAKPTETDPPSDIENGKNIDD
jgi:hypothetical protein